MKKSSFISSISFILLFSFNFLETPATEPQHHQIEGEWNPQKTVLLNLGYGARGFSGGFGFRYWLFGAQIGITGVGTKIPGYNTYDNPPGGVERKNFPSITVSGDVMLYYDINEEFSAFVSAGFYSQADTLLLWDRATNVYFLKTPTTEIKNGLTFGLGGQYYFKENLELGLGYHTKNGIYAQVGYWW